MCWSKTTPRLRTVGKQATAAPMNLTPMGGTVEAAEYFAESRELGMSCFFFLRLLLGHSCQINVIVPKDLFPLTPQGSQCRRVRRDHHLDVVCPLDDFSFTLIQGHVVSVDRVQQRAQCRALVSADSV